MRPSIQLTRLITFNSNSFLLLLVMHSLLEEMHLFLVAYCFYLFLVSNSFLFLVVRPGTPSSVLAPSSDALCREAMNMMPMRWIIPDCGWTETVKGMVQASNHLIFGRRLSHLSLYQLSILQSLFLSCLLSISLSLSPSLWAKVLPRIATVPKRKAFLCRKAARPHTVKI